MAKTADGLNCVVGDGHPTIQMKMLEGAVFNTLQLIIDRVWAALCRTKIPSREDWVNVQRLGHGHILFTDGPKSEKGVGLEICRPRLK